MRLYSVARHSRAVNGNQAAWKKSPNGHCRGEATKRLTMPGPTGGIAVSSDFFTQVTDGAVTHAANWVYHCISPCIKNDADLG
ncbi:MAG: hypothetical protein GWP08_17975 [Nitrospiraceae bacterium]|nr:hypothetical protein [Nitrospiraceae bacterium]